KRRTHLVWDLSSLSTTIKRGGSQEPVSGDGKKRQPRAAAARWAQRGWALQPPHAGRGADPGDDREAAHFHWDGCWPPSRRRAAPRDGPPERCRATLGPRRPGQELQGSAQGSRELWRLPVAIPSPRLGHLEQVTQERVQVGLECLQRGRFHKPPRAACHPQRKKKVPPRAEVELLVVLSVGTATRPSTSHAAEQTQRPGSGRCRRSRVGAEGRSQRLAGRGSGRRGCGEHQSALAAAREGGRKQRGGMGRETWPMASRDSRARAGLGRRSPSAVRKGGASQSRAAVVKGEPMASRAGGAPANQGASGEQKGLSKAPAPLPSTISHDATAAGSGSRAVPAAAI
ncbi:unnamed protein product, partial [Coccothraustes coccothraustes]